jgi:GH43 family beta-xylosidase
MPATYVNPVYPEVFADPFVLRHDGVYYAYGTAPVAADGGAVPVLRSTDLVAWSPLGHALAPTGAAHVWAPEVACHDGRFFMYYSSGGAAADGTDQRLRVATATHPAGPFVDGGKLLAPDQPFSIDAHPFRAPDGDWYLFYCVDFVEPDGDQRVGTGIVVDRLLDMTTLAGAPVTVVRPHEDWHVFRKDREMYGRVVDWHTVEGPAVLAHGGRYYCFYSGGAWEREHYGVGYVVADHPLGPYRRPADGASARLMRTPPGGQLLGPGHNCFTPAPDGGATWIVYHAWDPAQTARRMCIDRLDWRDGAPVTAAPTWTAQPAPEVGALRG